MNDIAPLDTAGTEVRIGHSNALLDPAYFQQVSAFADIMAKSSLIPDALRFEGSGNNKKLRPFNEVQANCFLVANQAFKWNMEPFGVAQACSVVHGRLMFEGKLVAAVLHANLGVRLHYEYGKWDAKTSSTILNQGVGSGDDLAVRVYEVIKVDADGNLVFGPRFMDGSVGGWKTTGDNSAWGRVSNHRTMLSYRGARQWARVFEPAIMIGVVTDDEADFFDNMRDITPTAGSSSQPTAKDVIDRVAAAKGKAADGFDNGRVQQTVTKEKEAETSNSTASEKEDDATGSASASSSATDAPEQTQADLLGDAGGDQAPDSDGEAASQASPSTSSKKTEATDPGPQEDEKKTDSVDGMKWLQSVTGMLWAATNFNGDIEVLKNQRKAAAAAYPADGVDEKVKKKATSVFDRCMDVVSGSLEPEDAKAMISGISGIEEAELDRIQNKARGTK